MGEPKRFLPASERSVRDLQFQIEFAQAKDWSSSFLPATYQGTLFCREGAAILYLDTPDTVGAKQQRSKLDLIAKLNRQFAEDKPADTELQTRLNSYTSLRIACSRLLRKRWISRRNRESTKKLYGMDEEKSAKYGTNLSLARRLVERGVWFVEAYCGSGSLCDVHTDMEGNHTKMWGASGKPIAGLLTDLKARGLLDDTLVVWGGEFGRTPFNEAVDGRDHNLWGFTMWTAGGGVKPAKSSIRRTKSACAPSTVPCMSTTFTPQYCTYWA